MHGLSKTLVTALHALKETHFISGLKAEFEAEGASFRDLVRLRYLTALAGVPLHVKIGGVEAVRDIKDCFELGVDGLIAPMVETKFGVKKFVDSVSKVFKQEKVHLTINVETRNAIDEIEDIIGFSSGRIDNVTIGRTDLSASYFDDAITPDSSFILDVVERVGTQLSRAGLTLTVGGTVSAASIEAIRVRPLLCSAIRRLETRKIMLPVEIAVANPDAIRDALKFEELYILSKKEISDLMIESELDRLTQLTRRTSCSSEAVRVPLVKSL